VIKVEALYKYYGSRRAVGPLSASIEDGEVVGLLGLNGAGKTTTLRILACDLLPSSGTVSIHGLDVVEQPDQVRRMVGYLPDTPPLYEEMSVRRYLAFAAQLRGVAAAAVQTKVEKAAALAGLSAHLNETIAALSHGYRQRVGIAQAIVHEPKLVILDEPSSGLDPVQIKDMRQLVRSLGGKHTVVVSSHNLPEISEMCDRLLVMGQGNIVAAGTEAELVSRWAESDTISVTVALPEGTDNEAARRWLAEVEGVRKVTVARAHDAADRGVSFELQTARELRAELARALVGKGWDLIHLSRSERELENVFSKLAFTAEAAAPRGSEEAA
jgi:ABC-2 type transport system ATP-binding protein